MQQINHRRHQNDAASNPQKADQHTNAKSEQKDDECHGERSTLGVFAQQFASSASIFLSPGSDGNLRSRSATLESATLFLFARNLLYLHVFVTSAGGLLAALQQPARGIPENVNLSTPANPGPEVKRSATELMPLDRRPEFFKGAQLKVGIIGC